MTLHSSKKELHFSEPVQEILGAVPSWVVRWGITVMTAVFALMVIGCCIIKYPQTISATISISSVNPPSQLEARYSGIIDTITVINGQNVRQGELLVLLKTPAVYEDVLSVKCFADSAGFCSLSEISADPIFDKTLELGSLQDKWTDMAALLREYRQYRDQDQIGKKWRLLSEQIRKNKEYCRILYGQRDLLEKDMRLQKLAMQRDSVLWSERLIAQADYDISQQAYLSKLNNLVAFEAALESANLNMLTLEQGLFELDMQSRAEEDMFNLRYSRTVAELLAQIASWTEMYAIVAPFDGVVSLQDFWGIGQHVRVGDVLVSVVPGTDAIADGRMKVSSVGFGRIEKGQTVNVRLNGFPYIEFGILKGEISKISQVPERLSDGSVAYHVEVSFPDGLVSTYHKRFPFIQDMDGEAEIVTQDRKLIAHFIEPVISLFRNR